MQYSSVNRDHVLLFYVPGPYIFYPFIRINTKDKKKLVH